MGSLGAVLPGSHHLFTGSGIFPNRDRKGPGCASRDDIAKVSADLLERAKRGGTDIGKVLSDTDWDMLPRSYADFI